jgi:hypothetical protein
LIIVADKILKLRRKKNFIQEASCFNPALCLTKKNAP